MMYKRILLITAVTMSLVLSFGACGKQSVNKPSDINVKGKTISYYSDKDAVEKVMGEGTEEKILSIEGYNYDDKLVLIYDDAGDTRCIEVNDSSVKTYKGIRVGDDLSRVTKAYQYETEMGDEYSVVYDGDKEIDPKSQGKADDLIWLNYTVDGDKISRITIYDVKFGRTMK